MAIVTDFAYRVDVELLGAWLCRLKFEPIRIEGEWVSQEDQEDEGEENHE
jgi:hypothetical protein